MSNLEIVGVRCPECESMVGTGDNHACWSQELGMQAFEEKMWKAAQDDDGFEPEFACSVCGDPSCYSCNLSEEDSAKVLRWAFEGFKREEF